MNMIHEEVIRMKTKGELDVIDITEDVKRVVEESGIKRGICLVFGKGSTLGIILNENDTMLLDDLKELIKELVPHKEYNHPVNARSHLRSILLRNQVSLPVKNGRLEIGTWQQVMVLELDTRPREREIIVTVVGES
ncbi:MAG: YjbQ family protein [Candidatus Aenigmarchaeota archaeon]|nr:YjbQ family protein [Candidatus Aenigmarchaeota archaeon]